MLEKVKLALRVDGALFDEEILSLIYACKKDLSACGIMANESDPLIERAIIFYCKAYFGYAGKYYNEVVNSYEALRRHLILCGEYKEK